MPWKDGYTISDERTLDRVEWPDGRRCAVVVVVDLAPRSGPDGVEPKDLAADDSEFGMNVGFWRLLELFARYDLKATFAVPAVIAEVYADHVREIARRGHEVAAHGYRHEDVSALAPGEERRRLELTTEILAGAVGGRPAGWFALPRQQDRYAGGQISRRTMDLLIDTGYDYMGNGTADDIPHYWVTDFATRRNILTLPYYYHFDDQFFLMFPAGGQGSGLENPRSLFENWKQEFDAACALGRYFTMTLHPGLIGWGGRLGLLEEMLGRIRNGPPTWNPTGVECARYWKATYPASSTLRLEPSIWHDYPDSLS